MIFARRGQLMWSFFLAAVFGGWVGSQMTRMGFRVGASKSILARPGKLMWTVCFDVEGLPTTSADGGRVPSNMIFARRGKPFGLCLAAVAGGWAASQKTV